MKNNKFMYKQKSFTLIELLVVIVIIGILAGVIMISTSSTIDKANFAKIKVFEESVRNAMMMDLFSEYPFDQISGTIDQPIADSVLVSDDCGNNNLYTAGGPILKAENDCVHGKCLDFINDSSTNLNRIHTSSGFDFSSVDFTISYWINKRGACRYQNSLYNNSEWGAVMEIVNSMNGNPTLYQYIAGNNKFDITIFFQDNTSSGELIIDIKKNILDDWHLITFSYNDNDNKLKAYLDGNIFYDNNIGEGKKIRISNNMRVSIGNLTTYWTKGKLDEFKYYKAVLSNSQIKQNYIAGLNSMLANGNISKEEYNERINNLAYNDNNE